MEEEKKTTTPTEIVDKIAAATYARHAGLPYEEFADLVGLDKDKEEGLAVREGKFKLMRAITLKVFNCINAVNVIDKTIQTLLVDNKKGE